MLRILWVGSHLLSCCTKLDVLSISDCEADQTLQALTVLLLGWYQVQIPPQENMDLTLQSGPVHARLRGCLQSGLPSVSEQQFKSRAAPALLLQLQCHLRPSWERQQGLALCFLFTQLF